MGRPRHTSFNYVALAVRQPQLCHQAHCMQGCDHACTLLEVFNRPCSLSLAKSNTYVCHLGVMVLQVVILNPLALP